MLLINVNCSGPIKDGINFYYDYDMLWHVNIFLAEDHAVLKFQSDFEKTMTTYKEESIWHLNELIDGDPLFSDVCRKLYLLHALTYAKGLKIKTMKITFWPEDYQKKEGKTTVSFETKAGESYGNYACPFVFSSISEKKLNLDPKKYEDVCMDLLGTTKTFQNQDKKCISLFSYLQSQNRELDMERFSNLWTSMNAFYGALTENYNSCVPKDQAVSDRSDGRQQKLMIRFLMYRAGFSVEDIGKVAGAAADEKLEKHLKQKQFDKIFKGLATCRLEEGRYTYQAEQLYRDAYEDFYKKHTAEIREGYRILAPKNWKEPLYPLLLVRYAYSLRCSFLHGSLSNMVFLKRYDYYGVFCGIVSFFLENFLSENIPLLFSESLKEEMGRFVENCGYVE